MFEKNDVGEANEFYKIKFAFGVDKPVRLRIVPDCQIRYKKTNSGWWHVSQCKPGTHLRNQSNITEGQCRTEIPPFTNPISSILNTFQQQHIELTNNPNNRWRHVGDWVALGDNDN